MSAAGRDAIAILAKHGIKPSKSQKANKAVEERALEIVKEKGPSRNDLMLKAKAKGIKNFRILNKEELTKVLVDSISPQEITVIVTAAIERWKAGWGTRKETANG
jgi:hypothetical protein